MPAKYIGALIFIWIIGALLGGVIEVAYLGSYEGSVLNCVLSYTVVSEEQEVGVVESPGPISGISSGIGWLNSVWTMLKFDFAFLHGEWRLVNWLLFAALTGTIVAGLIFMFFGQFQRAA